MINEKQKTDQTINKKHGQNHMNIDQNIITKKKKKKPIKIQYFKDKRI